MAYDGASYVPPTRSATNEPSTSSCTLIYGIGHTAERSASCSVCIALGRAPTVVDGRSDPHYRCRASCV